MRVLPLEDDAMIGEGLSRTLAMEGMSVDWVRRSRSNTRRGMA
jgi:DNA-binding response OmpR family regulator